MVQHFNMFNYAATLGRMISGMKYRPSRAIRRLEHQGEASWPGSTARAARAGERPCCGAGCDINDVRQPLGRHCDFWGPRKELRDVRWPQKCLRPDVWSQIQSIHLSKFQFVGMIIYIYIHIWSWQSQRRRFRAGKSRTMLRHIWGLCIKKWRCVMSMNGLKFQTLWPLISAMLLHCQTSDFCWPDPEPFVFEQRTCAVLEHLPPNKAMDWS